METFLWGLVKSVPTPTKSEARCLTHPVLTLVPAPPAQPLLTFKANFTFIVHVVR